MKNVGLKIWLIINIALVFFHSAFLFGYFISIFGIQPYAEVLYGGKIINNSHLIQEVGWGSIVALLYYTPLFFVDRKLRKNFSCYYGLAVVVTGSIGFFYVATVFLSAVDFLNLGVLSKIAGTVGIAFGSILFFCGLVLESLGNAGILIYFIEALFQIYILSKAGSLPFVKAVLIVALTWAMRTGFILLISYVMPYFYGVSL